MDDNCIKMVDDNCIKVTGDDCIDDVDELALAETFGKCIDEILKCHLLGRCFPSGFSKHCV